VTVYGLSTVVLVIVGQTLLKRGMNAVGPIGHVRLGSPLRLAGEMLRRWELWAGALVYAMSAATWLLTLSTTPLSAAYPFLVLWYVGVTVSAVTVLRERLTPAQWLGVALVIVGIAVLAVTG
jgi:drug/metabolite transporter (DMT)-like permease